MNIPLNMMNFAFKMMNFAFKMTGFAGEGSRESKIILEPRPWQFKGERPSKKAPKKK